MEARDHQRLLQTGFGLLVFVYSQSQQGDVRLSLQALRQTRTPVAGLEPATERAPDKYLKRRRRRRRKRRRGGGGGGAEEEEGEEDSIFPVLNRNLIQRTFSLKFSEFCALQFAPLPAPWPDGGPKRLRSPCCILAIYKHPTIKADDEFDNFKRHNFA
ncbi:hypothetical protein PoB_001277400 [Plakobranchus ocellatus]|uniref:Uncharacterized protein n=1 Tax=Plakobranchus ocellatus TaxID=259542 RepID=A0AAV3YW38_9GAST|nr:hypothetical protein PoB_001277400 [Plakobranchus ocellatus]